MGTNEPQHSSGFGPSKFQETDSPPSNLVEWPNSERRKQGYHPPCQLIIEVQDRLMRGDTAIHSIRNAQEELAAGVAEVLEILKSAKSFFRFTRVLGRGVWWCLKAVLWVSVLISAVAGAWYVLTKGGAR